MNRRLHIGFGAAAAGCLFALAAGGRAQDAKAPAWKPFIPAEAYKALAERGIKAAEDLGKAGSDKAMKRMQAEAILLVGYTLAARGDDDPVRGRLRLEALEVAREAGLKDRNASQLAARLRNPKNDLPAKPKSLEWRASMDDLGTLMDLFRPGAKGGEGLTPDLQYTPKLKNLNSTEDLIGALASKKLTDANAAKTSKDLELLGYRVAVIGAITRDYVPEGKTKGEPKQWVELSDEMRDSSVALAQAAQKKDAAAVQDAAKRLEGTCTKCHSLFR